MIVEVRNQNRQQPLPPYPSSDRRYDALNSGANQLSILKDRMEAICAAIKPQVVNRKTVSSYEIRPRKLCHQRLDVF